MKKKKLIKRSTVVALGLCFLGMTDIYALEGENIVHEENVNAPENVLLQEADRNGWYYEGEAVYYYQNGIMLQESGVLLDGYWYYFGNDGRMYCSEWREKDGG